MHHIEIVNRIDWTKPALCRLNALMSSSHIRLVGLNILSLLRWLFFLPLVIPKNRYHWVLISHFRPDLLQDFNLINDCLCSTYTKVVIRPYKEIKFCGIYINDLVFSWNMVGSLIYSVPAPINRTITTRLFFFFYVLEGIKLVRYLESKNTRVNSILSLMEMQCFENILVQYFRLSGTKTFAYQHGFYRDTGNTVTKKNSNPVNYLAAVCETALVWGEASKLVLGKYTSQSIVCVGKPTLLGKGESSTGGIRPDIENREVVVILDSYQQLEKNISIMKAVSESSCGNSVYYIPHPDDQYDYSKFNAVVISHQQINQQRHILAGNNSSAVLQYGRAGFNILLFEGSDFCCQCDRDLIERVSLVTKGELRFLNVGGKIALEFWSHYIENFGANCLAAITNEVLET